jgi:hypothetical protein
MAETEVYYSIVPEVGHCYEYAEATRKQGKYPNERYFTTNPLRYVGEFIRSVRGGNSEYGGFCAYFLDNHGKEQRVDYSYEGKTCFREVPCIPLTVPSLQSLSRHVVKTQVDYSALPEDDHRQNIIEETVPAKMGGKSKRHRKTTKNKKKRKSVKSKRRKSIVT